MVEIHTPDQLEYRYLPVTTGSMFLKVKAGNDAHIALAGKPSEDAPIVEIFIGGWKNSKSAIRKNREQPDKVVVDTPGILDAGDHRGFWLRWNNGLYDVGREADPKPFISWQDPEPFGIGYYGTSTGWGSTGQWVLEDGDSCKQHDTADDLKYSWHIVQQGCVEIEVCCPHNAHIALSGDAQDCDQMYEVMLGGWENSASVIRQRREKVDKVRANTPSLLCRDEFRRFCVAWKRGQIRVIDNAGRVLMEWEDAAPFGISHFGVRTGWGATGRWKVRTLERPERAAQGPVSRPSSGGNALPGWAGSDGPCATWIEANHGVIPTGAVQGGIDGEQLYIGRARHAGDIIPGKIVPSHKVCYVSWGGVEHSKLEYQVLCHCNATWVPVVDKQIPPGALKAGETADGEPLYVGRATHNGVLTVGKVQGSHGVCYVPYAGKEECHDQFDILVAS